MNAEVHVASRNEIPTVLLWSFVDRSYMSRLFAINLCTTLLQGTVSGSGNRVLRVHGPATPVAAAANGRLSPGRKPRTLPGAPPSADNDNLWSARVVVRGSSSPDRAQRSVSPLPFTRSASAPPDGLSQRNSPGGMLLCCTYLCLLEKLTSLSWLRYLPQSVWYYQAVTLHRLLRLTDVVRPGYVGFAQPR
jgi:hypothetical protein